MLTFSEYKEQADLRNEIDESHDEQDFEYGASVMAHSRLHDQMNTLEELGLDEIEAVEYVLLLSRDEEARNRSNTTDGLSRPVRSDDQLFNDNIQEAIRTPSDDIEPNSSESVTTSPSKSYMTHWRSPQFHMPCPSPSSSSHASPSFTSFSPTLHFVSSGYPKIAESSKIVVSPRTRPEPTEAGSSLDTNASLLQPSSSKLTDVSPSMTINSTTAMGPSHRRGSTSSINPAPGPIPASSSLSASPINPRTSCSPPSTASPTPSQTFPAINEAERTTNSVPSITLPSILRGSSYAATTASSPVAASGIARSRPILFTTGQKPSRSVSAKDDHDRNPITRRRSAQVDNIPLEAPKTREAEEAELALAIEMSLAETRKSGL